MINRIRSLVVSKNIPQFKEVIIECLPTGMLPFFDRNENDSVYTLTTTGLGFASDVSGRRPAKDMRVLPDMLEIIGWEGIDQMLEGLFKVGKDFAEKKELIIVYRVYENYPAFEIGFIMRDSLV